MLPLHTIAEFEQICTIHHSLNLNDFFELDTRLIPDEMYPHLFELEKHFAKSERALWTDYFKQECEKKRLQNPYLLFYGQTEMRMSDAMKQFYFLIENPISLDNIVLLTKNNKDVRYNQISDIHYISFQEDLIERPPRKKLFYALEANEDSFKLVEIARPKYLSYPYYVACQYAQMLRWTDLGDAVKERVGESGFGCKSSI